MDLSSRVTVQCPETLVNFNDQNNNIFFSVNSSNSRCYSSFYFVTSILSDSSLVNTSLLSYWHLSLTQDAARTQTNMTEVSSVVMSFYISVVGIPWLGLSRGSDIHVDKLGSEIESSFQMSLLLWFVHCMVKVL